MTQAGKTITYVKVLDPFIRLHWVYKHYTEALLSTMIKQFRCICFLLVYMRCALAANICDSGTYSASGNKCAGDWTYRNDFKRCAGRHSSTRSDGASMSFSQAETWCGSISQMFLPGDNAENIALLGYLVLQGWNENTWLGSKYIFEPVNDWSNDNYARGGIGEYPWDAGQPGSSSSEICLQFKTNGRWNDEGCGRAAWSLTCVKDTPCNYQRAICSQAFQCVSCDTTQNCGGGKYRTTCAAGANVNSACAACTAATCTIASNTRLKICSGDGTTSNSCQNCRANPTCAAGSWWSKCDRFDAGSDTSSCAPCTDVACGVHQRKALCPAGLTQTGSNSCANCDIQSCPAGAWLTRCTGTTDSVSRCNLCGAVTCGVGQFWQQCAPNQIVQASHTCASCRTDACGIGYFRARCDGTQVVDAACQVCTDTIVCPQNQYKIPCDGTLDGFERNSSSCNTCPVNSGSPAGSTSIESCQCIADHVIVPPNNVCQPCGPGTVKVGAACDRCPAGNQRLAGQSNCTACPPGQYKMTGQLFCTSCGVGKYREAVGATAETDCLKCVAGKYSSAVGAASAATCQNCPRGTACPRQGMVSVEQCAKGFATNTSGSTACVPCTIGTFSAHQGAHVCTGCNRGFFQDLPEQTACKICVPGTVSPGFSATGCAPCVPGKISAVPGGLVCADCEAQGLYSPNHGASVCMQCSAPGRESLGTSTCTECPAGKYKQNNSLSHCDTCLAVRSAVSAQDGGIAPSPASDRCTPCAWYQYWLNATRCEMCASGTFLDRTRVPVVCLPCRILDGDYCNRIAQEMVHLSLLQQSAQPSFTTKCQQSVASTSNNSHANPLCPGCACSLFRDAMRENESPPCQTVENPRMYFDGHIRNCTYCPVNRNINNHVSRRSCDLPDDTKHTEWDENTGASRCVPGYRQTLADPPCVACEVGTYQDKVGATSCTLCPGNTTTSNVGSISRHDCAWCSFHQRVVENAVTGAFSCRTCEMCSVIHERMHMLRSCTPCAYYDYDATLDKHPPTCVLVSCLDKVRTDSFKQDAGTFRADEQFGLISKKDMNSGTQWSAGFILMFVTEVQWIQQIRQGQPSSNRLDSLQTLDENFQQTSMFWFTNVYADLETSFAMMRDAGTPIYISFKDLFFRIFMHMALQTIHFNQISKSFDSTWNAENLGVGNDWVAYNNRIRQTGAMYMALEKSRSLVSAGYHAMPHSVAPLVDALVCPAVGAQNTLLQIVQPSNGASFSITTILVFAGVTVTTSHCLAGSECEKMFVTGTDFITLNNTHASIQFEHFNMFLLQDISFDITAATGANVLDFELSTPAVPTRRPITMEATLYWRRKPTTYQTCSRSHTAAKHAVITDPVAFTQIRQAFRHDQCTNVDYA